MASSLNELKLHVEDRPNPADLEFLEEQINEHNKVQTGVYVASALAIFVRDKNEAVIAGISGYTWAGMCEIHFLWVKPEERQKGYGRQLLEAAETEARARACAVIVLGTYSFQALEFYQKLGYGLAGKIEDCPPGHTHYYLFKRLPIDRRGEDLEGNQVLNQR
jgi:ribosomal protein S18 acetylase RimI-like enzyme